MSADPPLRSLLLTRLPEPSPGARNPCPSCMWWTPVSKLTGVGWHCFQVLSCRLGMFDVRCISLSHLYSCKLSTLLPWSFSNSDELMVHQAGHGQITPLFYCLIWSEAMFWGLPRKRYAAAMSVLSLAFHRMPLLGTVDSVFFLPPFSSLRSYLSVYQLVILCTFMTMFLGLCHFFFILSFWSLWYWLIFFP